MKTIDAQTLNEETPSIKSIKNGYKILFGEPCSTHEAEDIYREFSRRLETYYELQNINFDDGSRYSEEEPTIDGHLEMVKKDYERERLRRLETERLRTLTPLRRFSEMNGYTNSAKKEEKQKSELIAKFVDKYENESSNSMSLLIGKWNCSEEETRTIVKEICTELCSILNIDFEYLNFNDFFENHCNNAKDYFVGLAGDGERALRTIFSVIRCFEDYVNDLKSEVYQ